MEPVTIELEAQFRAQIDKFVELPSDMPGSYWNQVARDSGDNCV